jgi:hypothetical protein
LKIYDVKALLILDNGLIEICKNWEGIVIFNKIPVLIWSIM